MMSKRASSFSVCTSPAVPSLSHPPHPVMSGSCAELPEGQEKLLEGTEDLVKGRRSGGDTVRACHAGLRTAL